MTKPPGDALLAHLERATASQIPAEVVALDALQKLPDEMLDLLLNALSSIPHGEVRSVEAALAALSWPDRARVMSVWRAALLEAVQEVAAMN